MAAFADEATQLTNRLWGMITSGQALGLQNVDLPTLSEYITAAVGAWDILRQHNIKLGLPSLAVQPLQLFLDSAEQNPLSGADRQIILDQALSLFTLYPHLPFKVQNFPKTDDFPGVMPVALLNKIRSQLKELGETDFHLSVQLAFANVRDVHTSYVMPAFYQGSVAFLPFQVRFYEEAGTKHYVVTKIMETGIPTEFLDFQPGVEIVRWNGNPIADEVQQSSALHPGANPASAQLRGTVALTARPIGTLGLLASWTQPFAKDSFAVVNYIHPNSTPRKIVFPWAVATGFDVSQFFPGSAYSVSLSQRQVQFASDVFWGQELISQTKSIIADLGLQRAQPGTHSPPVCPTKDGKPAIDLSQLSVLPTVFQFQFADGTQQLPSQTNPAALMWNGKKCGYIRIASFGADLTALDVTRTLLDEFERILVIMNQQAPDGLILDIRTNPGGDIAAAERMLQMLTPGAILPERFQLANTPAVRAFLKLVASGLEQGHSELPADTVSEFRPWAADATMAPPPDGPLLTSGQYLTRPDDANDTGQIYQGPVVLLTDALTYSAADIFAGGFQDNNVGDVMGSDSTTGGGGANVWSHADLLTARVLPLQPLPGRLEHGAGFAQVGKGRQVDGGRAHRRLWRNAESAETQNPERHNRPRFAQLRSASVCLCSPGVEAGLPDRGTTSPDNRQRQSDAHRKKYRFAGVLPGPRKQSRPHCPCHLRDAANLCGSLFERCEAGYFQGQRTGRGRNAACRYHHSSPFGPAAQAALYLKTARKAGRAGKQGCPSAQAALHLTAAGRVA